MASTKRPLPEKDGGEPETKKSKVIEGDSSKSREAKQRVELNPADCNLDFNIKGNGLQGSALNEQGFAYCWSGARANVGITGGKYCFSCKIISAQPVEMVDTPLDKQHLCRLGISRGDVPVGNLGETEQSFGFGGTGKFSNASEFLDYGEKYGVGDTIVCAVNLENKPRSSVDFFKNGKWLGTAKYFDAGPSGLEVVDSPIRKLHWESAFFPHVLLKNVVVQLQFSIEDGLVPEEGYKPWSSALEDGNAVIGPTFFDPKDCEVIMMVGLPASGKTTWADKWAKEHPEKRYLVLGTNLAMDQMKVPGLMRKHNYGERFDRLMDCATGIFNTLLSRASKTPHNYIIDQTNVYKNARKRKLKPFADFRKIAVVVFPSHEELKFRAEKRFKEMGKEVPKEAVNEMLANYTLPMSKDMPGADEYFDKVWFPELNRVDSEFYLDEMKYELRVLSPDVLSPYSLKTFRRPSGTPYSCESSINSYNRLPMQNQGTLIAETGRQQQSSRPSHPPLSYAHQSAGQANSSFLGTGLPGGVESFPSAYQATQYAPVWRDAPFGNFSNPTGSLPRGEFNRHGNYTGYEQSRNIESRIGIVEGVADPYQTYGMGEPNLHPSVQNKNFIPGGAADNFQGGSLSYNDHGGRNIVSGSMLAPRQNTFPPFPPPTYGFHHETPVPTPLSGNFASYMPRGYIPPRRW